MKGILSQKFRPIGLKRNQFSVIAFIVFLAAWITVIAGVPPMHVTKVAIGDSAPLVGQNPLLVEIYEISEINVDGDAVTLIMLTEIAEQMRVQSRTIILKPNACAPYDTVIKTIAAIKRSGANFLFAPPNYSTHFDRSTFGATHDNSGKWGSYNIIYSSAQERFQVRQIRTVIFTHECQRKANSSSEFHTLKSISSS
jgi:biopolymer transport protein ExbD